MSKITKRKQKFIGFFVLLCILFLCTCFPVFCKDKIKIYHDKEMDIFFTLRISTMFIYDILESESGFQLPYAQIGFDGRISEDFVFSISMDPLFYYDYYETNNTFVKNLYLDYTFSNWIAVRIGQFKVPFGEELFLNPGERPYIDHFITTSELTPGRDKGVMVYGKKIFDFLYYNLGYFSGMDISSNFLSKENGLFAGKVKCVLGNTVEIACGLEGVFKYDTLNSFSDGAFFSLSAHSAKNHSFYLFCEFLEKNYINKSPGTSFFTSRGFMSFISYRFGLWEPFVFFEIYDDIVDYVNNSDCLNSGIGVKNYINKNRITTKLMYNLKYFEYSGEFKNIISLLVQLEI